jgi:hypothetical protein
MLQGSLENFALDEVLGLLSGTSKTGHLEIAGNRGTGSLIFHDGRLVDGTASFTANGTDLEDVMFELLRYRDGTFTFSARDVDPTDLVENVATVLANAESRLQDWRSIEDVVPSLSHRVLPVLELPSDEVTVSRDEWATLMTIGTGCPVSHVCDRLSLGEVEGSRRIKNLAERQLVDVTAPIAAAKPSRTAAPAALAAPAAVQAPEPVAVPNGSAANGHGAVAEAANGNGAVAEAPNLEALAGTEAATGPALGSLMAERPPMPAAPAESDLPAPAVPTPQPVAVPPGPPSPAEIAGFSETVEDASELMETVEEARGGILARYLKGDD